MDNRKLKSLQLNTKLKEVSVSRSFFYSLKSQFEDIKEIISNTKRFVDNTWESIPVHSQYNYHFAGNSNSIARDKLHVSKSDQSYPGYRITSNETTNRAKSLYHNSDSSNDGKKSETTEHFKPNIASPATNNEIEQIRRHVYELSEADIENHPELESIPERFLATMTLAFLGSITQIWVNYLNKSKVTFKTD